MSAAYFAVYVLVTALSLPGATVLTLAGGAGLGLLWGTLLVSFASTLGATLAMLSARYLLRGATEKRFASRLAEINQGLQRDGGFYLFSLRLMPVVPFFALNLLMGLTRMKTWTFYWVSQLGMLAGTLAYVNAGTQLARIESLSGIVSPGVLGSLVLLGIFGPRIGAGLHEVDKRLGRRGGGPRRRRGPTRQDGGRIATVHADRQIFLDLVGEGVGGEGDDGDLIRKELAQADQLRGQVGIILRVDDTEGDGTELICHDGAHDFFRRQGRAKVSHVPPRLAGQSGRDGCAHFMQLPRGSGDQQSGRRLRRGHGPEVAGQIIFKRRGGTMLVRGREIAARPSVANRPQQWDQKLFKQAGVAQFYHALVENFLQFRHVITADGAQRGLHQIRRGDCQRGGTGGRLSRFDRFPGSTGRSLQEPQFFQRQSGDLTDGQTGLGEPAQQGEPLHFLLGIQAALSFRPYRCHRAVTPLPHPDEVRAEASTEFHRFHVVKSFAAHVE